MFSNFGFTLWSCLMQMCVVHLGDWIDETPLEVMLYSEDDLACLWKNELKTNDNWWFGCDEAPMNRNLRLQR